MFPPRRSSGIAAGIIAALSIMVHAQAQKPTLLPSFSDVPSSHPLFDAIEYGKASGVITGYSDGTFRPGNLINRAEFTKIVIGSTFAKGFIDACASEIPRPLLPEPGLVFLDVALHQWFGPSVCMGKKEEIIGGYPDGTFRPTLSINFAEAAKILAKSMNLTASGTFLASDPWYKEPVSALIERRAIPVSIGRFDQRITRGEMMEMIYRLKQKIVSKPSVAWDDLSSTGRFEIAKVQVSDKLGFMTVKKITPGAPPYGLVEFRGEMFVTGQYTSVANAGGSTATVCFFRIEDASFDVLPHVRGRPATTFCLTNLALSKAYFPDGSSGKAAIIIDNFKINYTSTGGNDEATLVKVIER